MPDRAAGPLYCRIMAETDTESSTTFDAVASCVSATLDGLMDAVPMGEALAASGGDADQAASECAALAIYALALATLATPVARMSMAELLEEAGRRVGQLNVDLQPLVLQLARRLSVAWPENLV